MTSPLYSLEELNKMTHFDTETLNRTKKFGIGMFWGNFITILLALGFGTPFLLNKIVKKSVENDVKKYEQAKNQNQENTLVTLFKNPELASE